MKITHQITSFYRVLSTACLIKSFSRASVGVLTAIALGVAACSPTEPVTEAPTSEAANAAANEATSEVASEADAGANASSASATTKVYEESGIAIGGADPVAYFENDLADGEFVEGSPEYTHEWQGVTWQFASAENRDAFAANPDQYAPEYGGFCAWAAAQNKLAAISPDAWSIVDGKLYLNANQNIQTRWEKDIPGFIAQANENWPTLSM